MSWWCAATGSPWSWTPIAYPGIWLAMVALVALYVRSWRRLDDEGALGADDGRRRWAFGAGVVALWIATDWPVGALGSGYLASVHMVQFQLYSLVAAPLLLVGMPPAMFERLLVRLHLADIGPTMARPVVAGVTFNLLLVASHSPFVVDRARTNQVGSFVLDLVWLVAGVIVWLPVIGPKGYRHPSPAVQCLYLFLAMGVIPMIPGALLTFSSLPLYSVYELAPRVGSIDVTADQQVAGLIMKVGNLPVLWVAIAAIFFTWARRDRASERPGADALAGELDGAR
jgi:putative membrane protein